MTFSTFIDEQQGTVRKPYVNTTVILTTIKHVNRYDSGTTTYVTGNDLGSIIWLDVLFCRFVLQTASMIRNINLKK